MQSLPSIPTGLTHRRLSVAWCILSLLIVGSAQLSAASPDENHSDGGVAKAPALFARYCLDCHGNSLQEAELNIEALLEQTPLVRNRERWRNVRLRAEQGDMPPEGAEQPTPEQRKQMVAWLKSQIDEFDYSTIDDPGAEPIRRLTHLEFIHTVQTLLGVRLDPKRFPEDLSGQSGFDNSANTLFLHPLLLEKYILAIDDAIEAAKPARWQWVLPSETVDASTAAKQMLVPFLRLAYRRPPTKAEIASTMQTFSVGYAREKDYRQAIKRTLKAVLLNPSFLLRIEQHRPQTGSYRIGPYEMASRLSYFLWADMPDEELLQLAEKKQLFDPNVLAKQVRRMLADPRAESLGTSFAAQWLGFDDLGKRIRRDPIDNPWCTDSLMAAMRAETALFIVHLLRENRPLSELVDANYTFLNEELARHYRIRGVKGEQMRLVKLADAGRRGGIFGQGSLHAVTSFPGRTSPVVRGKWILSDVLGTPPPPPPPGVSEFDEEIEDRDNLSMRAKMELHRADKRCASCHDQIDPLGFALENFDDFGRWRTRRDGRFIDSRAVLPGGGKFRGPQGLKRVILAQRKDELSRQLTRKILAYALGRQLEYYDERAVRDIVAHLRAHNEALQELIIGVVTSYPFQYKKNPTSAR